MTQEEIDAAKAAQDLVKGLETVEVIDPLAEKDAKIAKLTEDYENIKKVALKRLGKLPGDADFLGDAELTVAEQVRQALLEKEIELEKKAKDDETLKILRENSELKLALKNRPAQSIGGGDGATVEVKDNVLTDSQITTLTAKAKSLGADPAKFIENFKKTLSAHK